MKILTLMGFVGMRADWAFYGRQMELRKLQDILPRRRWFFLRISGRRRIGKTTWIQQALRAAGFGALMIQRGPSHEPN